LVEGGTHRPEVRLNEAELIGAAKSGDRHAFDELVRRTFVDSFTLARRLTGNEEDARDVVQEAYLRAWKGIGKFRGEAAFSTWMYRITANAAATHVHKRRRQRAEPFADDFEPVDTHAERAVSQGAESAESLERISRALDELPAKLRSVVVLKDVYGLSHEAIAEELGITVAAAKVRLHRARHKLRDVLYDEGAQADAV
jgi:RNA polymerase sigma-70 factor (ECF subfamily)